MSAPRYRPKRRLRSEIFPLVSIISLPVALYLAFPGGAIGFVPSKSAARGTARSAFITLDGERERKLLASARATWQSDSASRRGIRANLLTCEGASGNRHLDSGLPPSVPDRLDRTVEYEFMAVPQGVAAGAPATLSVDPVPAAEPAFPKSDLLKLK